MSGCSAASSTVSQEESLETAESESETAAVGIGNSGESASLEATENESGEASSETEEQAEDITIDVTPEEAQTEETAEATESNAPSKDVDLIFFMGQSNMSGCGGDYTQAPQVISGAGYEYRSISDPYTLHEIREPFGFSESVPGSIWDVPGAKKGSMVSAFVNKYYTDTGRTVIAVSASAGGTSTEDWLSPGFVADISVRVKNAQEYLQNNGYNVGHQYVVWLQGESDALDGMTFEGYKTNMDDIIRPLFIAGFTKVFIITPGRTSINGNFFNNIINAQIDMCKNSGYYALATTALCAVSTSYMVDEWHYNQKVLNLIGTEAGEAAAYYTNNNKEMCVYDYKHNETVVPLFFDYDENTRVETKDINGILAQQ